MPDFYLKKEYKKKLKLYLTITLIVSQKPTWEKLQLTWMICNEVISIICLWTLVIKIGNIGWVVT